MIYTLTELTWFELMELDKEKLVVMLPIAPIEQHGVHLPLGVDCYLTNSWAEECMKELSEYNWIKIPIQTVGSADLPYFAGNMHITQNTLCQYVYELLNNYVSWGLKNTVVISAHADPKHAIAIEKACSEINKRFGVSCFAPLGSIFSNDNGVVKQDYDDRLKVMLNDYPNDFHAGWIETSLMLYIMEEHVRGCYKECESTDVTIKDLMRLKKLEKKIKGKGHMGYPQLSNKQLGELLQKDMIKRLSKRIDCFLKREAYELYEHHALYRVKFLHPKSIKVVK